MKRCGVDKERQTGKQLFPALNAALLAFVAGLPFYVSGIAYSALFLLFHLCFVVTACWTMKASPSFLLTLKTNNPLLFWLLSGWIVSATLSWLWVLLKPEISFEQYLTSTLRHLYDLSVLGLCLFLAKLIALGAVRPIHLLLALSVGFVILLGLQGFVLMHYSVPADDWFQAPLFGPHIRDHGNLACVLSVSAAALLLMTRKIDIKDLGWASLFAVATAFVIWTGGRMAMASVAVTLLFLVAFSLCQQATWLIKCVRIVVLMALVGLAFKLADAFSLYEWNGLGRAAEQVQSVAATVTEAPKVAEQSTSVISQGKLNQLTTGRAHMWQLSIHAMLEEPWFGLGPYGYFFIPERVYDDQPHNFIVQFLVEWGVIGAVLMISMLLGLAWFLIKQLYQTRQQPSLDLLMSAAIVCVLTLHGLTGGTYFKIQPLTCLMIGFAGVLAVYYRQTIETT